MRITILAIGSRGDVQPLVALGLGLQRAGHEVCVVTADDFETFVRGRGLDFFPLGVSVRRLLETGAAQAPLETGNNVIRGMWQLIRVMQPFLEQLMEGTWRACQGTEAIIYSTLGVGAYNIAEKLDLPCCWALSFPIFSRTRAMPSIAFPLLPLGGLYNLLSHIFVEQLAQQFVGRFINRWRQERLDLPPISLFKWPYGQLRGRPVPTLYSFSPAVVPRPPDWGDHVHVTGYWFLDRPSDWRPPADLVDFFESGPPPVYVGFGSMSHRDPERATRIVLDALRQSGQRGLIATGWGGLSRADLPADVFELESVPHDWLFPRVAAVVHHGGAGTTAAGLRAGVPSVILPHFGDQPFWARQVERLGVGPKPILRKKLTAERLADAVRAAVEDETMRARAAALGEKIRAEDGVGNVLRVFERAVVEW